MKKRRALLFSLLVLLLIVGIPTGFLLGEYHHARMNRAIIRAIKTNDTKAALVALDAGAEADLPHPIVRPAWILWLDRMAGLKTSSPKVGPSLLAQAVQHNNTVLVKALLTKGATDVQGLIVSTENRYSPDEPIPLLAVAAEAGNLAVCEALVAHGADVNQGESNCALKMAATRGHGAVILFLFQHGAVLDLPDGMDGYSLMDAARSGDAESVRLLLAHGANAQYTGRFDSVLSAAVTGGNLAAVKMLTEAGADVNGGGAYTGVLQDAAEAGDVEIVRYLLQKGAKVNGEFRWNRTPLLEALKMGNTAVAKLLLEHGADWRPKVEEDGMDFTKGDTALSLAHENREIVRMLKKAGAKE